MVERRVFSDAEICKLFSVHPILKIEEVKSREKVPPRSPVVQLEFPTSDGASAVLRADFGTPTAKLETFWLALTGPFGGLIGWVRFERGICVNSTALFAATEMRSAGDGVLVPEPVVKSPLSLST